jgi:TolB-like protein
MRAAVLLALVGCASAVQAPAVPTARFPKTWSAAVEKKAALLAVLDFKSKLRDDAVDASYFSNQVRAAALRQARTVRVMTRENILVLLESQGKKLEDCEGECEIDTGRRLGADYVVSGEILRVGSSYKLDLRLHETRDGQLLGGAAASGHTVDELDANATGVIGELLAPLR